MNDEIQDVLNLNYYYYYYHQTQMSGLVAQKRYIIIHYHDGAPPFITMKRSCYMIEKLQRWIACCVGDNLPLLKSLSQSTNHSLRDTFRLDYVKDTV